MNKKDKQGNLNIRNQIQRYADDMSFRVAFIIGYRRELKGIDRRHLSELSGIPCCKIKKIEDYEIIPDMHTALCLMKALGYSLDLSSVEDS